MASLQRKLANSLGIAPISMWLRQPSIRSGHRNRRRLVPKYWIGEALEARRLFSAESAAWMPTELAASRLLIHGAPAVASVNHELGGLSGLRVSVLTNRGAVLTMDQSPITLSVIRTGTTAPSEISSVTVNAVHGIATFKNIAIDAAGTYSLEVRQGAVVGTTPITVTSATSVKPASLTATTTTVSSSNSSSTLGQSVMFTATIAPNGGGETGTVQFQIDGANAGSPVMVSANAASYSISNLTAGSHSIVAIYSGDSNFAASTSAAFTQTISQATPAAVWWNVNALLTFSTITQPQGVVMDSSGDLFEAPYSSGAIFEIAHGATTTTKLANFNAATGTTCSDGLTIDSSGDLYGMSASGGANSYGAIFELVHGATSVTALAPSTSTGPVGETAPLTLDSSGDLFGASGNGGSGGVGALFELAKGSNSITTITSFTGANGRAPGVGGVLFDSSGDIFGTTQSGGTYSDGNIFELPKGATSTVSLVSFNGTNGRYPDGIAIDSSGDLLGTTNTGGASNVGDVYELAKGATTITVLASFVTTNGAMPYCNLVMDSSGDLFGTTTSGGPASDGTLFEVPHGLSSIVMLTAFGGANGADPGSEIAIDSAGDIFGTTAAGGVGYGVVFEASVASGALSASSSYSQTVAVTTNVTPLGGILPTGTVQFQVNGVNSGSPVPLIGTTATYQAANLPAGVYSIVAVYSGDSNYLSATTAAFTRTVTQDITSTDWPINSISIKGSLGSSPWGGVVLDSSGDLFGMSHYGGASGDGAVWEIAHGATSASLLATFSGANGNMPDAGLTIDSSGDLFGDTYEGGNLTVNSGLGYGSVFEIVAGTSAIATLATFSGANGEFPEGTVTLDSSGDIFGTTYGGGTSSYGTLFEVIKGSSTITSLASFTGTNGENAESGVVIDSSGDLFGSVGFGGSTGVGGVYELVHNATSITRLAPFTQQALAYYGGAGLVMDTSGNLFGTRETDGIYSDGSVFELTKNATTISIVASFNSADGLNPMGTPTLDSSGDLYGTTYKGGYYGDGEVFEIPHNSSQINILTAFTGANGSAPLKPTLVFDSSGNLYGTTEYGGSSNSGTVFEIGAGAASVYGQTMSLTVTVPPNVGVGATGSVQFQLNGANYGSPVSLVGQTATLSTTTLPAGTDSIVAVYSGDNNFVGSSSLAYVVTVAQATPTITWAQPGAITYGAALSSTQLDASANVQGTYSYSPTVGSVLNTGTQVLSLTFTPMDSTDYKTAAAMVNLTVNPATLTVTANNASRNYGAANPTLTASITGFVNNDTIAVVSGAASLSTTATVSSAVGSYPITVAQGTLAASNYNFTFVSGSLMVLAVAPTLVSSTVGDGTAQRSYVSSLTVVFSEAVNFGSASFSLYLEPLNADGSINQAGSTTDVSTSVTASNPSNDGMTWVLSTAGGATLPNGIYQLVLHGSQITDSSGQAYFNGGMDQIVQFNSVEAGGMSNYFHVLFGDINGDGTVNLTDYRAFIAAFLSSSGDPNWNPDFDYGQYGTINLSDYRAFTNDFLTSYIY